MDEQKLDKKDRQPSKLNTDGSTGVCAEGYIAESDKENGSLCDTNLCDTREMQSSIVVEYSESERTKDPTVTSRIKAKDFLQNDSNEVETRVERKPTSGVRSTGKRANEETDGPISVKRMKSTDKEHYFGSTKKEANDYDTIESHREHDFIKHNKSKSSKHFSEKQRDAFKGSHVERARDSSIEGKTRGHLASDRINKPKDRRQDKRNESEVSSEKKDSLNDHLSKRCTRKQTAQNCTLAFDERNTIYRGTEIFDKRKNHGITSDERRRAKQREENRRMTITEEDRRSRGRLTSSYGKLREERYDRTKHNNNRRDTCEDRCEPGYDFRSSNADKVKTSNLVDKELCCNPRVTIERTKRSSMDRGGKRAGSVQSSGRHDEYESRRLKTGVKATKREKKQEEHNDEYSRRKCAKREKSIEKSDCLSDRFGRSEQAEADCAAAGFHGGESRECVDKAQELELEDGKNLASPVNSPCNNNSKRERSTDGRRDATSAQKLSSLIDVVEKNVEPDEKVKGAISAEESQTLSDHVSGCFPTITETNAASLDETRLGNTESIENVENVENIEKFIRDYLSNGESVTEVPADSNRQTVTVTNVPTDSGVVNDDDSEREKRSNESQLPDTKVDEEFSLNGKETIDTKGETVVAGNSSLCVSKCFAENSQMETQPTMVTLVENVDHVHENERAEINPVVELSEKNCTLDETAKNVSILIQIEPPSGNNTVKHSCRTVLESYGEKECDGNVDNNCSDRCNDLDVENPKVGGNDHDHDHNKVDAGNSCKKDTDMKEGTVNASIRRAPLENETISKVGGEDGVRLSKPLTNVQAKIVVFARRKKPVCLANNNANMTVLIRNNHEANTSLHGTKNTTVCDYLPKLRLCRRPRREENKSVGS